MHKGNTSKTANAIALEKAFAREYVKRGMNGTKAYKAIRPHVSDEFARVGGSRLIAKDTVQKSIVELLPRDDEDTDVIKSAYRADRPSEIAWTELHKYVELSLKLKGKLGEKQGNTVNIAIVKSD